MMDKLSHQANVRSGASCIHLEYGADEFRCDEEQLEICERGMRFNSRWQFQPGTELGVAFQHSNGNGGVPRRIHTEGVIAACEPAGPRCYRLTLVFVDLPEDQRQEIRAISSGLATAAAER